MSSRGLRIRPREGYFDSDGFVYSGNLWLGEREVLGCTLSWLKLP
jgi:hypothetical protein